MSGCRSNSSEVVITNSSDEEYLSDAEGKISALESKLEAVQSELSDAESEIRTLKSAVDDLTGQIDRFDYDNWQDIVPNIRSSADDIERASCDVASSIDDAISAAN